MIIKVNQISRLKCLDLMIKKHYKSCELLSVIITIPGSCLLGGCMYCTIWAVLYV